VKTKILDQTLVLLDLVLSELDKEEIAELSIVLL